MQALSTVQPGENYEIKWMFGVPEILGHSKISRRADRRNRGISPCVEQRYRRSDSGLTRRFRKTKMQNF